MHEVMIQETNTENCILALCSKDLYLSEKSLNLMFLNPRTAHELH